MTAEEAIAAAQAEIEALLRSQVWPNRRALREAYLRIEAHLAAAAAALEEPE